MKTAVPLLPRTLLFPSVYKMPSLQPEAEAGAGEREGGGDGQEQSTRELMRLSEALEEADALRVSVRSRDAALQAQV